MKPRRPGRGSGLRIWLLRHLPVHPDWTGRAYGDLDVPLAEEAETEIEGLARTFAGVEPVEVLSSPLSRALRLATPLARASAAPLAVLPELREIHRGAWQGLTVDELHRKHADSVREFYRDPWSFRGHGGESDQDLSRRVWDALAPRLEGAANRTLVVVSHYNVIRVVVADALGIPSSQSFSLRVDPGRATLLFDGPGGWVLRRSNVRSPEGQNPSIGREISPR